MKLDIYYIIGLNFLKRSNIFFDMKNKELGLQSIEIFNGWQILSMNVCIIQPLKRVRENIL